MLDDICQFCDFNRSIVEQRFPLRHYIAASSQYRSESASLPRIGIPFHVRWASLSNFAIVPVMPLPISAALRANSDLVPLRAPFASPFGDPEASLLCLSESSDCRCAPIFEIAWRFSICVRIERNSLVRS